MQRTIHFTQTSERDWAATAYIRRQVFVVQLFLVCVAAGALSASYLAWSCGQVFGVLICVSISFFALCLVAFIWSKNRKFDHEDCQRQVDFSDQGFNCGEGEEVVPWTAVHLVRKTAVFWAVHFRQAGRDPILIIPTEAIDAELSTLIDFHTPMAKKLSH